MSFKLGSYEKHPLSLERGDIQLKPVATKINVLHILIFVFIELNGHFGKTCYFMAIYIYTDISIRKKN